MSVFSDPWRLRCPQGHASLSTARGGYRCLACGTVVDYVVDCATGREIEGRLKA